MTPVVPGGGKGNEEGSLQQVEAAAGGNPEVNKKQNKTKYMAAANVKTEQRNRQARIKDLLRRRV